MQTHQKTILLVSAFLGLMFFGLDLQAQCAKGKVIEGNSISSEILGKEVTYSIYLPPGYDRSERSYPVVYLLHGYTDDETAWVQFGQVQMSADKAIANGDIPPMIIVMPDAGVTWYINDYKGETRYEDMFFQEFIPHVENQYRIRGKKEYRGISGLSMGGYGSLIYALHHPDQFAACAAFSAAVMTDEEVVNMDYARYNAWFASLYGEDKTGEDRLTEHWYKNSVLHLMKNLKEGEKNQVRYYIDCGDDDFLYKGNSTLHMLMREQNIPHEYRVRDGKHEWEYWRTGIVEGLKFIGQSFHR